MFVQFDKNFKESLHYRGVFQKEKTYEVLQLHKIFENASRKKVSGVYQLAPNVSVIL